MNNLGGFKSVELIFVDEVQAFVNTPLGAYISKLTNSVRLLPIHQNGTHITITSKTEASGTLYTSKATIHIQSKDITPELHAELKHVDVRGCRLIATTNNNTKRVYGCQSHPLYGTFVEIPGKQPSDLHYQELTLTSTGSYTAIPPIE